MPYVSDAQRRWAHTATGTKALGGSAKVAEWDRASKGKDLPMKAASKGSGPVTAKYAQGGEVLTSRSRFMKTPDTFRTDKQKTDYGATKDPLCDPEGETKVLKTIKPRT